MAADAARLEFPVRCFPGTFRLHDQGFPVGDQPLVSCSISPDDRSRRRPSDPRYSFHSHGPIASSSSTSATSTIPMCFVMRALRYSAVRPHQGPRCTPSFGGVRSLSGFHKVKNRDRSCLTFGGKTAISRWCRYPQRRQTFCAGRRSPTKSPWTIPFMSHPPKCSLLLYFS